MIEPTVGRKVWYRPSAADKAGNFGMKTAGDQPLDATVVAVWGPRTVNLAVLDANGNPFTRTSVPLLQDDDTPPTNAAGEIQGGYAEWMPFQKGQAARAN